jgi:hypothetical protein
MTFLSSLAAFTFIALALISAWWTTRKARDVLQKSLGRTIRDREEMSLKSWMEVSDQNLDSARMALKRNPFDRALKLLFGDPPMTVDANEIIRIRPDSDPSSPSVLWSASRDRNLAFCEMRFMPNGVEVSVMRNGTRQ